MEVRKLMGLQTSTKNYEELGNAESRRKGLPREEPTNCLFNTKWLALRSYINSQHIWTKLLSYLEVNVSVCLCV